MRGFSGDLLSTGWAARIVSGGIPLCYRRRVGPILNLMNMEWARPKWRWRETTPTMRRFAPAVELLPVLSAVPLLSFLSFEYPLYRIFVPFTVLLPLGLFAGMGWMLLGHWRIGIIVAATRFVLLIAGGYLYFSLLFASWCDIDDSCTGDALTNGAMATPILLFLFAALALGSCASSFFAGRAAAAQTVTHS